MKTDPEELINFDELRQHVAGYEALFHRLLQLLIEQAPLWIDELDHAFAADDPHLVRKVCHKIKGSAGTLHARSIIESTAELRAHALTGDLSGADESRTRLVEAIKATVAFVRTSGHI